MRTFCDFEDNDKSYVYVGETAPLKHLGKIFKNIKDLRNACSKFGLQALEITNDH